MAIARRITDKRAVLIALHLAIDTEKSLIASHRNAHTGHLNEDEPGVIRARHNIEAFNRVLDRYYGGKRPTATETGEPISILQLMRAAAPSDG